MCGNLTFLIPHGKPKAFFSSENRFAYFLGSSSLLEGNTELSGFSVYHGHNKIPGCVPLTHHPTFLMLQGPSLELP